MDELINTKKILYISYDGMTDPLGQSQVLPYLCGLTKSGFQFTILSFEKKQRFEKGRQIINKITTDAGIKWVPLKFSKNPPILSKIYDRWQLSKATKKLHKEHHFDMIHCRSYVAAEFGLKLKEKTGVKFLFDMRGFWADEKVDNGQWDIKNLFFRKVYKHYKDKEREYLLKADAIISLTYAAKTDILLKKEYQDLHIDVIPCCADLDHFNYLNSKGDEKKKIQQELGLGPDKKVISYLGSVGGWYMVNEMFTFFKLLRKRHPGFVMMVLTKDDPDRVKQLARETGIPPDKLIVRYAERKVLPDYISLSNCSIFFIRPSYSKIASSPTKHAELMGMGIPVICNNIGDTGAVIEETGTGIVVKEFSDESYNKVIDQIDQVLAIPKGKIRDAAFQYFDLENGIAEYVKVYKRVLNN